jgi:Ca-activated chloride channel family protein
MRVRTALLVTLALPACSMSGLDAGAPPAPQPVARGGGDRYTAVGTNPFVRTDFDPFSTFAVDVDTASYDIFRRDVERGALPDPASVRVEEYVNSFAYDYPVPAHDAPTPFTLSLGGGSAFTEAGTAIVRVGLQAKASRPSERVPANLVFLIDTSCSMQGTDRLPLVQLVLSHTLEALADDDSVSIVTYAGSTRVALPATPAANRAEIQAVIDAFAADGSTAGGAGLDLAYAEAERARIPGGLNHVVLCTDGDFNVGPSSDEALLEKVRSKRASGVTLAVLGFGEGNLNDSMMEKISNAGDGFYSVISSATQARLYGRTQLLQTADVIARDVKLQVEFNPAHIAAYRLLGYENRLIDDAAFRDDRVDGGEVGSGHRVTALYEVVRAGAAVPVAAGAPAVRDGQPVLAARSVAADDALTVRVRYKRLEDGDDDAAAEVRASLSPAALELQSAGDPDTKFAAAVAAWAEILKQSPYADRSQLDAIEAVAQAQAGRDEARAEFARLLAAARPRLP